MIVFLIGGFKAAENNDFLSGNLERTGIDKSQLVVFRNVVNHLPCVLFNLENLNLAYKLIGLIVVHISEGSTLA